MNELKVPYAPSNQLYWLLFNSTAQYWNGSAFENGNSTHYSTYPMNLSDPVGAGLYVGNWPSTNSTNGNYFVGVKVRTGSNPALTDLFVGSATVRWNGSTELFPASPGDQMDLVNSPNPAAVSTFAAANSTGGGGGISLSQPLPSTVIPNTVGSALVNANSFGLGQLFGGSVSSPGQPAIYGTTITAFNDYPLAVGFVASTTDSSNWTQFVFTTKQKLAMADSTSVLMVKVSNPAAGDDGLVLINGAPPASSTSTLISDARLVVNNVLGSTNVSLSITAEGMQIPMSSTNPFVWELTPYINSTKAPLIGRGFFVSNQSVLRTPYTVP